MMRMQARCSAAKVRPCSGCTRASAVKSVVDAMTTHRRAPAAAASAMTRGAPRRLTRGGPTRKKTTTSAATDSDQSTLATAGVTPAARQRMTANASCMA